jgi:hypothetical protein
MTGNIETEMRLIEDCKGKGDRRTEEAPSEQRYGWSSRP